MFPYIYSELSYDEQISVTRKYVSPLIKFTVLTRILGRERHKLDNYSVKRGFLGIHSN